ncbi:MAG TPA: hypothetical protein VLG46_04960 [Anaerolineae bacterium]|nr:hypothetical protein [Anaerolineae bacterium]
MKREIWLLIIGTVVAISILGGLWLLLAAQPSVALEPTGKSLSLEEAPFIVKVLVGLAMLVSGALLLTPIFQAESTTSLRERNRGTRFSQE